MAYDGLTHRWPDGRLAGVAYDIWAEYDRNRALYAQYNKPVPRAQNIVAEPDGSVWEYAFLFDDPFNYYAKTPIQLPNVTPGGELLDPGGPTGPTVPGPGIPPDPGVPGYPPEWLPSPDPSIPPQAPTAPGEGNADMLALFGLALVGIDLGLTRRRRKK